MSGVNWMVGPQDAGGYYDYDNRDDSTIIVTPDGHPMIVGGNRDGTEITVATIVLVAFVFLVLLRMGGFQTVIAASVSSAR